MEENNLNLLKQKCKDLVVLYVEDDEKVKMQTSKVLSIYFENIKTASDGKEALEKFKNEKFHIVFTDINMPKMDGLQLVNHIRRIDLNTPIVVFSAYDNTEYFLKSIEYGVDGYILKPFKFNQIQKVIEKIIKKIEEFSEQTHILELVDGFTWELESLTLSKNSKPIELTKNEKALFKLLSSSKNALFSSEEIELVLFNDNYCDNKRVRGLISRLHIKVGSHLIKSKYGQGYELNLEE